MDLTKKDHVFQWGTAEQGMFDMLKCMFTSALVLAYLDPHCLLYVETDASVFAIGVVLSMKCNDREWWPCTYYSHALLGSKLN